MHKTSPPSTVIIISNLVFSTYYCTFFLYLHIYIHAKVRKYSLGMSLDMFYILHSVRLTDFGKITKMVNIREV